MITGMLTVSALSGSYGGKRVQQGCPPPFPLLLGLSGAEKSVLVWLLATAETPGAGAAAWDGR